MTDAVIELDERGRRCPLPVIALARAAAVAPGGSAIRVLSDDPGSLADIPAWCRLKGLTLAAIDDLPDGGSAFTVAIDRPARALEHPGRIKPTDP